MSPLAAAGYRHGRHALRWTAAAAGGLVACNNVTEGYMPCNKASCYVAHHLRCRLFHLSARRPAGSGWTADCCGGAPGAARCLCIHHYSIPTTVRTPSICWGLYFAAATSLTCTQCSPCDSGSRRPGSASAGSLTSPVKLTTVSSVAGCPDVCVDNAMQLGSGQNNWH